MQKLYLSHKCQTQGLWAKSGPPGHFMGPLHVACYCAAYNMQVLPQSPKMLCKDARILPSGTSNPSFPSSEESESTAAWVAYSTLRNVVLAIAHSPSYSSQRGLFDGVT